MEVNFILNLKEIKLGGDFKQFIQNEVMRLRKKKGNNANYLYKKHEGLRYF